MKRTVIHSIGYDVITRTLHSWFSRIKYDDAFREKQWLHRYYVSGGDSRLFFFSKDFSLSTGHRRRSLISARKTYTARHRKHYTSNQCDIIFLMTFIRSGQVFLLFFFLLSRVDPIEFFIELTQKERERERKKLRGPRVSSTRRRR